MHVFLRKSPLCRSHFFEWLKTANLSTACGTVTLKSPLSQAFFVPDVHPRLRKHLARCTLDCGFKTSESPALRGFEAERGPVRGTSLYLYQNRTAFPVQKSGLKSLAFRPKAFPQISPRSYRHNAVPNRFSTSLTIGPRPLSQVKAGTHSAFGEGSHTAAYTPKQGRFGWGWFHYPRSVPHVRKPPRAGCQNGVLCRFWVLIGYAPEERREPSGQRCA